METIERWRDIIENILNDYVEFYRPANARFYDENMVEVVFDRKHDRYLLLDVGWRKYDRIHNAILHLDIINGKIWVQEDNTKRGVVTDLENCGVPKDKIVLAFKSPALRKYTDYAAA